MRRDELFAGLLSGLHKKTVAEHFKLVAAREGYRARWHEAWNTAGIDFLLSAPNALPAVPNGGMKTGWKVCGYTFLFNLVCPLYFTILSKYLISLISFLLTQLDYTAGVQPITHVSASLDAWQFTSLTHTNVIAKDAFALYDANAMDGLPVGVQVVGRRLEEEKVLAGMHLVEKIMREHGEGYELLEI